MEVFALTGEVGWERKGSYDRLIAYVQYVGKTKGSVLKRVVRYGVRKREKQCENDPALVVREMEGLLNCLRMVRTRKISRVYGEIGVA